MRRVTIVLYGFLFLLGAVLVAQVSAYAYEPSALAPLQRQQSQVPVAVRDADARRLLEAKLERFFAEELMAFIDNVIYIPLQTEPKRMQHYAQSLLEEARDIDSELTELYGVQSRLGDVLQLVVDAVMENRDPYEMLSKVRHIVNSTNNFFRTSGLPFYLFVNAEFVREGRLSILPCRVESYRKIALHDREIEVFFLELIHFRKRTDKRKVPHRWQREVNTHMTVLPFRAKYIAGTRHLCVSNLVIKGDLAAKNKMLKAYLAQFSAGHKKGKKRVWTSENLTVMEAVQGTLLMSEFRSYAASLVSTSEREDSTLLEHYAARIRSNAVLFAYGKYRAQEYMKTVLPMASTYVKHIPLSKQNWIRSIYDDIVGSLVALSFGDHIGSSEIHRLLTMSQNPDGWYRSAIASRYVLRHIALELLTGLHAGNVVLHSDLNAALCERGNALRYYEAFSQILFERALGNGDIQRAAQNILRRGLDREDLYLNEIKPYFSEGIALSLEDYFVISGGQRFATPRFDIENDINILKHEYLEVDRIEQQHTQRLHMLKSA